MISSKYRAAWLGAVVVLGLTASTVSIRSAHAQEASPAGAEAGQTPAQKPRQQQPSPVVRAFAAAKPTPEQDEKFKAMTKQMTADLRAMRGKNSTVEASERPAKVRAMQTKYQEDSRALLTTDEQKKAFDDEMAKAPRPGGRAGQNNGIMTQLDSLELTADQKTKVEPLIADTQKQIMALEPAERRTKTPEMLADLKAKMRPLLTADQQTKLDALTLRMQRGRGGAGGGNRNRQGGGQNTPPPATP